MGYLRMETHRLKSIAIKQGSECRRYKIRNLCPIGDGVVAVSIPNHPYRELITPLPDCRIVERNPIEEIAASAPIFRMRNLLARFAPAVGLFN